MHFEIDQAYYGFRLILKELVSELNSQALLFKHILSGAELLVLENDDDNKVFSVTFRTPPTNDTGVAHILEHSVLCGSRKYPVKEPFMELLKGSLKTFLNAMTFPDKTMYPVASRNQKDLHNLMSVYLDAVYFPKITQEIFMQEGWHHELESAEEDIVYKGVVLNEMKGVFSDPESLLERYLSHSLFPETTYGYESGGDPRSIPDLSYEEFKAFHDKFYHPSNSRLFLYGDGDTGAYLKFIDKDYLNEFAHRSVDSSISLQSRFNKPRRNVIHYPISRGESKEKKTFILIGLILGQATNQEHCLSFNILSHLLVGTEASPLRKALIESGLGSEVIGGGFDDHRLETIFAIGLKGAELENEQLIIDLIFNTLRQLVDHGIEGDMVEAAVNSVDFKLREANFGGFPKGIVYNIQALSSWLYDADPLMHLKYDVLMEKIKKESKNGYFENLISEFLLQNPHQSLIIGTPRTGLMEEQDKEIRDKLYEYKKSLDKDQGSHIIEKTKKLKTMQLEPDSLESLASLPKLELSDLNQVTQKFPIYIKNETTPTILYHDLFTNGIGYVQVGFNSQSVSLDDIQYLPLLGRMLLEMGTHKSSYVEIFQQMGIHTGGIRSSHFSSLSLEDPKRIVSYIFLNGKAVLEKLDSLFDIYTELLTGYNFDNPKRLIEIIRSVKADMESSLIPNGNQYVASRLNSYNSQIGQYDEFTSGITYFDFLKKLLSRAEKKPDEVAESFCRIAEELFTKNNLLINVTSEEKDYPLFEEKITGFTDQFSVCNQQPVELEFKQPNLNEAFPTASKVQYVGKGANLYQLGFEYSGKFEVMKAILNTSYLWENVRMQGGAYGCSSSFDFYSGDFDIISYRDPNLKETLKIYDGIAGYVKKLELPKEELTKFIIGCVGRLDPPLTPDRKGSISMIDYLTGMTYERRQKRREQVLATTVEDIKLFAELFKEISFRGNICVLGSEEKINKADDLFRNIVNLFD